MLEKTFLENRIENFIWFAGIIITGVFFKAFLSKLLSQLLFRIVKKYSSGLSFEKFLALLKAPFGLFVILITVYLAFSHLHFPQKWNMADVSEVGIRMIFFKTFYISIAISITWIILRLTDFFGLILMERAEKTSSITDDQLVPFIKETIKIIIVIFSFFFILGAIFKVNIASLIAGLGIGGLAIALAAKETLENLLGSFAIFLDKPFQVGDYIKIDNHAGIVEKIGFRSTRIRTEERSLLTVPNKKLIDSGVDNLSMRSERRVRFTIHLPSDTDTEKISEIMKQIEYQLYLRNDITEEIKVKLFDIGNQGFTVIVNYFMQPIDWSAFVDVKNEINLKILEILKLNNCSMAKNVWISQDPLI